jgi:septal ring factor EnvC (AmiA/AmiB activator)
MDIVSIVNVLKDVPLDKMIILFLLTFSSSFSFYVIKNNTKAVNGLTSTLQLITTNQTVHDERNKSDFKSVRSDISNVRTDVTRVEHDVAAVQDNVNDISRTVSMIQGQIVK